MRTNTGLSTTDNLPATGPEVAPAQADETSNFNQFLHSATLFSNFADYEPPDLSHEKIGGIFHLDQLQLTPYTKFAEAVGTGAIHRTVLFPLESVTTRMMLGESAKGNYFRGLGTCIATGAVGKAASMNSNKAVRESLENRNVHGATLIAGVAAGGVETALNPINVIAQQAKVLPRNEVIPALKKLPAKAYYNGGVALIGQNVIGAALWYHGNAMVRNQEDSLPVEAGKSAAVSAVASAATWPVHLMHVQRIGVNGVSPSYKEIFQGAMKQGLVKGLKLGAFFPAGLLRVVISGAILGPLMNRFNEK